MEALRELIRLTLIAYYRSRMLFDGAEQMYPADIFDTLELNWGAGVLLSAFTGSTFGFYVALAGLLLFAAVVAFQLITTPVELDASRRALRLLAENGVIYPEEQDGARRMLRAAAFTYWVALFGAVLTLLYYASLVFGNRRND